MEQNRPLSADYVCVCVHSFFAVFSPYLCDPSSVHPCGFGLWLPLATSSCVHYCECDMNHMLIQTHILVSGSLRLICLDIRIDKSVGVDKTNDPLLNWKPCFPIK